MKNNFLPENLEHLSNRFNIEKIYTGMRSKQNLVTQLRLKGTSLRMAPKSFV